MEQQWQERGNTQNSDLQENTGSQCFGNSQTTREIHDVADAGISVCSPVLLPQALFSKSMTPGEGELLCGAALPSSHGRVGGPGVGTAGWGQSRTCTGDTSAEDLCMVNIPFPSSSCRLGFGEDLAWPPETVTVTQMPSCFSGNLRNAPWDSERVPSPWRSRVMLGSASSCLFELCD